jgi:hypothetical protein
VTVTGKVPAAVEVQDRVAVCGDGGSVKLGGVILQIRGAGATTLRETVPVKLLRPVTDRVEVAAVTPSAGAAFGAEAAIVKSTTWNRIDPVEWLSVPLTPVTVTV